MDYVCLWELSLVFVVFGCLLLKSVNADSEF